MTQLVPTHPPSSSRHDARMRALIDIGALSVRSLERKYFAALSVTAGLFTHCSTVLMTEASGIVVGNAKFLPQAQLERWAGGLSDRRLAAPRLLDGAAVAEWLPGSGAARPECLLAVPLELSGEQCGLLLVLCWDTHLLNDEDVEYFELLARWAAGALDRARVHAELREKEERLRCVTESVRDVLFQTDASGRWTYLNEAWTGLLGYSVDEAMHTSFLDYVHVDERQRYAALFEPLVKGSKDGCRHEVRCLSKSGQPVWVEVSARALSDDDGQVTGAAGVLRDMTQRHLYEERLRLAASVFTNVREGIMITSASGEILDTNAAFTRITGYTAEEVRGKNPRMLQSGRQPPQFYRCMWTELTANGFWQGEMWNRRKDGEVYVEFLTISAIRDAQGNIDHYVGLFGDITAQKKHHLELERIANFDALTGLPNRRLLVDRLGQSMALAMRQNTTLALAYLDLDGFKEINDQHGHKCGDELLVALAARMSAAVRDSDTICRLGGDEFVAVLLDTHPQENSDVFARLLQACSDPVQINDHLLQVSASIGVAYYRAGDDADSDQLLRQADQAMYQAKLAGKNRWVVFDAEQQRCAISQRRSVEAIREALPRGEFVMYYQPIIDLLSGDTLCAEALIRWRHPQDGLLTPQHFLPLIQNDAFAVELGEWTIREAIRQLEQWQAQGIGIAISVNIGSRQLQQEDFVHRLDRLLSAHPAVPRDRLKLEVLETQALEDIDHVSCVIRECARMGVSFALDDFGTGYSSLLYLKRLPAATIKIDQSFVRDMLDDPDDLAILEGVLALASAFRRDAVAEGVESADHANMLIQLGCRMAQGYGIARPMPAADMPGWLSSWELPASVRRTQPLPSHQLVLLAIEVECNAWRKTIHARLAGEAASCRLLHENSRLLRWLTQAERAHGRERRSLDEVETLARQLDELGGKLDEGACTESLLAQVDALLDRLLRQMRSVTRVGVQAADLACQ